MTTAVYSNKSLGINAGILSASRINVSIETDARPEEISSFLISLAASIQETVKVKEETATATQDDITMSAYYLNKYGDEYAYIDELGFECSYMGSRADHNHIF